jgi:hypothetical protein
MKGTKGVIKEVGGEGKDHGICCNQRRKMSERRILNIVK